MSTVGPNDGGYLAPAMQPGACSTSLQEALYRNDVGQIGGISAVEVGTAIPGRPSPYPRFALRQPEGTWLGFDGALWRAATPERRQPEDTPLWTGPRTTTSSAPACGLARSIRKARYGNHEVVQWHPSDQVARAPCTHQIDFDSEGVDETVAWVVIDGKPGLQIKGLGRGAALFGAGRPTALKVLDGEPGCHRAPVSLDDVWNVTPAPWDGAAWHFDDGRTPPRTPS